MHTMGLESEVVTVGFDIGGTNMRAAAVTNDGEILNATSVPTPRTATALEEGIKSLVEELSQEHIIGAVGLAVAGFLDPTCEIVRFAPHLPWRDRAVRSHLEQLLGLPVRLEHDANSAAWGEYRFGRAQGSQNWVLFALGTGIGATLMINGEIYRGAYGTAPEFGHLQVVRGGRQCACGKRGCLERYCSGTALVQTAQEILTRDQRPSPLRALAEEGTLTGKQVANWAREGDPVALEVMEDFSYWLGQALAIVGDVLDPELIVIGGGVSSAADLFLESATKQYQDSVVGAGYRPLATISTAQLGSDAGMIGVADLARQVLLEMKS